MKENSKGGLPEASAAEPEKKKRKSATLPAVPEPAVQSESTPVAPAAEQCEASESPRKKPAARRAKAKAKAKGRPRGPSAPAHPEGPEQEEPTAKKAKKGPKGGGIGKNGGVDKELAKTMQEFMRSYTSKKYVKSQEQLRKVPGFNLYFAREAAAFKMQDAEGKARQIGYFGLRLDKCCSQAVNVYLARAYYDKMASESLSCEWADSEPGLDYRALLINTADFAHKCLK